MDVIRLTQSCAEAVVQEQRIESRLVFVKTGESIQSAGFPDLFPMGNLQSLVFYALLLREPEVHVRIPILSELIPISYMQPSPRLLESLDSHTSTELKLSARKPPPGGRGFVWDQFYFWLFEEAFGRSQADLKIEIKKLFDMSLRAEHFPALDSVFEILLPEDAILPLTSMVQSFCHDHESSLEDGRIRFTNHPLQEHGIQFPKGCFYECSGYNGHCFFLPDLEIMALFHSSAPFTSIWYVFLTLLGEMEYFDTPELYLKKLEESMKIYPWLEVSVETE